MTSAPVTDIGMVMPYVKGTGGPVQSGGSDFMGNLKSALEFQSGNSDALPTPGAGGGADVVDRKPADQSGQKAKSEAKQPKEEQHIDRTDKTAQSKKEERVTEKDAGKVSDSAEKIVNETADQLDVTSEEVKTAMETLGLTLIDLFDPNNMVNLVAQISGNQDVVTLVTDESLYQTLGELKEFVASETVNLMEELDLSQEALGEVLEQAEELIQQTVATDMTGVLEDSVDDVPLEGMKDFKMTTLVNGEEVTMSVEVDDATGAQMATIQTRNTNQSQTGDSSEDKGETSDDAKAQTSLFTQTVQVNNNIEVSDFSQVAEEMSSFRTDPADIADQILESMKANLKPEMTELEMTLHPATLGNVRVSLTAQNGQITAQFLAQNEAVKAAIESQVAQLTNQLEDQGIKVEQVEVAVATHYFDGNQGNANQEGNNPDNQTAKPKVGRIRKIDLNALESDEDLEELEEEDRIAAEMMAHDGNTVDYMA